MASLEAEEAPPPPPVAHAHHPPPPALLALYKEYMKKDIPLLENDPYILDLADISEYHARRLMKKGELSKETLYTAYEEFLGGPAALAEDVEDLKQIRQTVYTHANVPGQRAFCELG